MIRCPICRSEDIAPATRLRKLRRCGAVLKVVFHKSECRACGLAFTSGTQLGLNTVALQEALAGAPRPELHAQKKRRNGLT